MNQTPAKRRKATIGGVLQTRQVGPTTVLGFASQFSDVPGKIGAVVLAELKRLIQSSGCRVLAFDLTGVKYVPSSLLGMLVSIASLVDELHVYNPSDAICEVIEIYGFDKIMKQDFSSGDLTV